MIWTKLNHSHFNQKTIKQHKVSSDSGRYWVIPLHGPITARSDLLPSFGRNFFVDLAKDFQTALDDDQVKAILFDVDSREVLP